MGRAAEPARTLWLGGVWVFAFALTPLLGYGAPLGFAPLMALVGLLSLPALRSGRFGASPALLLLAALAVWATLSVDWSPYSPPDGDFESLTALKLLVQVAVLGGACAAARRLAPAQARWAQAVLAVGIAGLAVVFVIDALSGAKLYQAGRALVGEPPLRPELARRNLAQAGFVLALLFWPAALAMVRLRLTWATPAVLAAIIVAAGLLGADAPILALLVAAAAAATVFWGGRLGGLMLIPPIALAFALPPLVVTQPGVFDFLHRGLPPSWDARLDIWTFTGARIVEHPLRGWGLDASRTFGAAIPLHPHNAALQLWLELGAAGAALGAGFFCWCAYTVARHAEQDRGEAAAAAGALAAYLTIGAVSFGVWQEWWIGLGALAVAACIVLQRARSDRR